MPRKPSRCDRRFLPHTGEVVNPIDWLGESAAVVYIQETGDAELNLKYLVRDEHTHTRRGIKIALTRASLAGFGPSLFSARVRSPVHMQNLD